jgi:hypothetical protein
MGVKTNLNIKTMVRLNVLFDVVKNLSSAMGFPQYIADTLDKGIKQRQILESVYAYYIDDNGKAVGKVLFNIDWEKYNMYASTESGKEVKINSDVPLVEKFAMWSTDIVNYINDMRKALNVKDIKVYVRCRPEYRDNEEKRKEADEFLNLVRAKNAIEFDENKQEIFDREMEYVSEILPELTIEVKSKI